MPDMQQPTLREAAMRALVVDGNQKIVQILSSFFRLFGYCVDEARDGREAVRHLLANRYDMVITDSELINIDGPELCKFIKSHCQGVYIIGMSGYLSALDDLKDSGADACFAKPFDLHALRPLIEGRYAPLQ